MSENYTTNLQTNNTTNQPIDHPSNHPGNEIRPLDQEEDSRTPDFGSETGDKMNGEDTIPTETEHANGAMTETSEKRDERGGEAKRDGRTFRIRKETADLTMVTSMRLSVSTVERLDAYCWQHRLRKQDVVQAALEVYFQGMEAKLPRTDE